MPLLYLRDVTTLRLDRDACTGCRVCTFVCPRDVFVMEEKRARIVNQDACIECGACALNCADGALTVKAGVGCAQAIINSKLGRRNACCVIDPPEGEGCGPG
jgi:NAD-dependent dihydropyrimidine dehydrogenase PreA subunit